MIVATAGHVDHGKTSLVKHLTGVDTDRLPEEKKRGLTIDLGFAYHDLGGAEPDDELVGFVDVPGHERFVRTMVAGVCGIDFVLFVVAADDGPMPQTAEHLAILDLLGVRRGAIVITKVDRVAPARVEEVRNQIALMTVNTGLAGLPVTNVSSVTGEGLDALRDTLRAARAATPPRTTAGDFRLAVDRSFLKDGAGRVVTGTVFAGQLELDHPVRLAPAGGSARVRGIHANNRDATVARAGQRCALNLAGAEVRRHGISRGHWVVADDGLVECVRFDALVRVLPGEQQPLRNRTPVHVHHGAADITGRIMLHEGSEIAPGDSAIAQVLLHQPLSAVHGEHFVLRDTSSRRTLGGGTVVDPLPLTRRATRTLRAGLRAAMTADAPGEALDKLLEMADCEIDVERFRRAWNLTASECSELLAKRPVERIESRGGPRAVSAARWKHLVALCGSTLDAWHGKHPGQAGAKPAELRQALPERIDQDVFAAVLDAALAGGMVERDGIMLRRPGYRSQRSAADDALWQRVADEFERHGAKAPVVRDLAEALKMDFTRLEKFLVIATAEGHAVRVSKNRFFLAVTIRELASVAEVQAARDAAGFTAAAFRDGAGIGRNAAIEVLEYFDRLGFTVRVGQVRRILRPAAEVFA